MTEAHWTQSPPGLEPETDPTGKTATARKLYYVQQPETQTTGGDSDDGGEDTKREKYLLSGEARELPRKARKRLLHDGVFLSMNGSVHVVATQATLIPRRVVLALAVRTVAAIYQLIWLVSNFGVFSLLIFGLFTWDPSGLEQSTNLDGEHAATLLNYLNIVWQSTSLATVASKYLFFSGVEDGAKACDVGSTMQQVGAGSIIFPMPARPHVSIGIWGASFFALSFLVRRIFVRQTSLGSTLCAAAASVFMAGTDWFWAPILEGRHNPLISIALAVIAAAILQR